MSVITLQLTAHDPLIARDGRPFGVGQGNRMRSLAWPLPSVVAGSFRTALVKANPGLDFTRETPLALLRVEVAGVFPTAKNQLYLPAPNDCLWDERTDKIFRIQPDPLGEDEGVDFPGEAPLVPVQLTSDQSVEDFKPKGIPAWWPREKYQDWLVNQGTVRSSDWFNSSFLKAPQPEVRDHVSIDAKTGAAAEGEIFATAGLNLTHLPHFGVAESEPFHRRFAEITLSARVTVVEKAVDHVEQLNAWSPLGGERRLVHWRTSGQLDLGNGYRPVSHRRCVAWSGTSASSGLGEFGLVLAEASSGRLGRRREDH